MTDLFDLEDQPERRSAVLGEGGYERQDRDAYFTQAWVTRALLKAEKFSAVVWEPACGIGMMAKEISAAGYSVWASDIFEYDGYPNEVIDFFEAALPQAGSPATAIITNPPFDISRRFIAHAVSLMEPIQGKVAIVQRHDFDAPKTNRPLFTSLPYARKLILPRRPYWYLWDEETKTASIPLGKKGKPEAPRFPYSWYIWDWRHSGPPITRWIDE